MLRNTIQRLSCAANSLAYVVVFGVVIIHVLHRRTAANVGPGDHNVVFWFEAGDDGDDQSPFHRAFNITARVLFGALGTFAITALCDAAGGTIGTASVMGLFVPLYCLGVGFGLKEATGLAQAAIAGASFTSLAFTLFRSHPWDPCKPLLDLDLALILAPMGVLGTSVGVLLNDLLPTWLITLLLVGLLVYVCRRKALTGLTALHEEAQHEAAQAAAAAISNGPVPRLRPICTASSSSGDSPKDAVTQAVQPCTDSSSSATAGSSPRGAIPEAVQQQQQQQQWDGPQLLVPAAAATVDSMYDHLLGSSGSSDGMPPGDVPAMVPATPAIVGCGPGADAVVVAAAVDSHAGSSEAMSSSHQQHQQQQQPSPFQQLLQQQQQQQLRVKHNMCSGDGASSRSSSDDLRRPLLNCSDKCLATAAAADVGDSSSSSRSTPATRTRRFLPTVPFISSVALPLPPLSPPKLSQNPTDQPAAAAAAPTRSSALFAGHVVKFSDFPWIKLISMLMLYFGFLGLEMLGGLIPLCSWGFVTYMVLYVGLTVFVTYVFVKLILIDPLATAEAHSKQSSEMEEGTTDAAAAGRANARQLSFRERFVTWMNVVTGTEVAVKQAAADEQQQATGHLTISLFKRQQLKQQLQLQQPFLHQQHTFTNIKSAAAAAAVAAAAVAEAHDILHADGAESGPVNNNLFVPQQSTLVHVAAAGAAVAGAAGVVTGVCGLAGAALLVPILLDFRVHPQVATATSVLLVCMSSTAAVLSFLMQGRLVIGYTVLFASLAVLGVCAGFWVVSGFVQHTCRPSIMILLLAVLTGLAALVTLLYGAEEFAIDFAAGEGLGFRALCSYR